MAEESCGKWLCTCLCTRYVTLASYLSLILGALVGLVAVVFMVTVASSLSGAGADVFNHLIKVQWLQFFCLGAGVFLLAAGCLGLRFANHRKRIVGNAYLACLIIAFMCQVSVFRMANTTMGSLSAIDEATTNSRVASSDPMEAEKRAAEAAQKANDKCPLDCLRRFARLDHECAIEEVCTSPRWEAKCSDCLQCKGAEDIKVAIEQGQWRSCCMSWCDDKFTNAGDTEKVCKWKTKKCSRCTKCSQYVSGDDPDGVPMAHRDLKQQIEDMKNKLEPLRTSTKQAAEQADRFYRQSLRDTTRTLLAKTYQSFADRFGLPKADNPESVMKAKKCKMKEMTDGTTQEVAWTQANQEQKCAAGLMTFSCGDADEFQTFAASLTERCNPKPGSEAQFGKNCLTCLPTEHGRGGFWEAAGLDHYLKTLSDKIFASEEYEHMFKHEVHGAAYCRCWARTLDSVDRHRWKIRLVSFALSTVQLGLVASVVWLILCGPAAVEGPVEGPAEGLVGTEMSHRSTDKVDVVCPPNSGPGQTVMITLSDGRSVAAIVPAGVMPGQMFRVSL